MAYLKKNSKISATKDQEKIAIITRAVKHFEFKTMKNVQQAKRISKKITEESLRLTSQYGRKMNHKNFNLQLAAEYEAEQQILFDLMCLLNKKILSFFESVF